MKKSGIVLCVFALVLLLCGICICQYAKSSAARDGVDIFSNTVTGENGNVRTISIDSDLNYIIVNYDNVYINVYGNSDRNALELINFTENNISQKNTGITITDSKDTFSSLYDTLKNFNGIRNIIFPDKAPKGDKKINIYLSGEYNITQLKFVLENGDINISDLDSNTDYTVSLTGQGNVSMFNVKTKSNIKINANEAKISFSDVEYHSVTGTLTKGNAYLTENNAGDHIYNTKCIDGRIYLNSESQGTSYINETAMYQNSFDFEITNGNLYISSPTNNDEDDSGEDTEDENTQNDDFSDFDE